MATATAVNFSVPSVPVAAEATTAQNIAKQRQLHARRQQSATGGLHSLGESFVPFFEEVRGNVREEYEDQESRLQGVEDHIGRIQRALVIEQQRRVEMLKTVKSNLQQQCDEAHAKCRAQLEALRPDIPARIEAWHGRCQAAEEWVAEERILRNKASGHAPRPRPPAERRALPSLPAAAVPPLHPRPTRAPLVAGDRPRAPEAAAARRGL